MIHPSPVRFSPVQASPVSATPVYRCTHKSPFGRLLIEVTDAGVRRIDFNDDVLAVADKHPLLDRARRQLDQYFAGTRYQFDLPLAAVGTVFQRRVWDALCTVGYGRTCSYADIARLIDAPTAMRAVGAANGRNPIGIVVPCHRVIGANGTLTGYAGGLARKEGLLRLEGVSGRWTTAAVWKEPA